MQNSYLGLLGLAKRAGKVESGDEAARSALTSKAARLVLIAGDASERTAETFRFIAESVNVPSVTVQETRADIGNALGKRPCAVVAVCDMGFAAALVKKLAENSEEAKAVLEETTRRAAKIQARKNKGKRKK